ncbi:MAG: ASKHA domain-containing protein [Desulfomonilaceae bacterium]
MPLLKVNWQGKQRTLSFQSDPSLREILDTTDSRVRSGCRGNGRCGLCLVQVETGTVNEPTENERLGLTQEQLDQGIRFACQVVPLHDLRISIVNPAPTSNWKSIATHEYFSPLASPTIINTQRQGNRLSKGVAIDLGTTHISITLWDMYGGKRLAGRSGLNPQLLFGADVMTRVVATTESVERAREISQLAVDAVGEALFDICSREGLNPLEITHVSIVGNTAELALLSEKNYDMLLQPKFWTSQIVCQPGNTRPWSVAWHVNPDAVVDIVAPLAGFIGSDLLAGVLATAMTAQPKVTLLIDFGTNSEIALWDGSVLWVTSAAGGPAFEGSGLSCGMPAVPGAIYQIEQNELSQDFTFQVLAGADPKGLCGSGLVDLIACLLRAGALDRKGKLTGEMAGEGFPLLKGSRRGIVLTNKDVDIFQRAKAAIGAGTRLLLKSAGMTTKKLERVYVSGAFGRFLNVRNAQNIGLLPGVAPHSIELCGNTALAGCEMLLASPDRLIELESIRKRARVINMSNHSEFEELFLENLYVKPMETD